MIKISVIIPAYNDEEYLQECLNSVVSQTLHDIEIICINDGSTDRTLNILQDYKNRWDNIIIQNQENMGVSSARNKGIQLAKGEYITFMDADDYYPENDVLECLYKTVKSEQVKICGGSYCQDWQGHIVEQFSSLNQNQVVLYNRKQKFADYAFPAGFTRFIYDRKMLVDNEVTFPDISCFEDPLFLVRAMSIANEIYFISKRVYCHRKAIHSRKFTYKEVMELLESFSEIMKIAFQKNYEKLQLNTAKIMIDTYYQYIVKMYFEHREEIMSVFNEITAFIIEELKNDHEDIFSCFSKKGIESSIEDAKKEGHSLNEIISRHKDVIIYGTGNVGKFVKNLISDFWGRNIKGFAVTWQAEKGKVVEGVSVLSIYDWMAYKEKGLFIISTVDAYQNEIRDTLKKLDVQNIYAINYKRLFIFKEYMKNIEI